MIKIDDTYFIEVDSLCYTAKRKQPGKNKKGDDIMTEVTIGYYGSVSAALRAAMDDITKRKLSDGDYTLEDAVKAINETYSMFEKILKDSVREDLK